MGLTTVMVTHDVLEAVLLADRIIVMRGGQIVADGAPRELLAGHPDDGRSRADGNAAPAGRARAARCSAKASPRG